MTTGHRTALLDVNVLIALAWPNHAMTANDGHEFWVDDVAKVTAGLGDTSLLRRHRDVTDAHLLALAERRGGALVTFDVRLSGLLGARPAELVSILR